MKLPEHFYLHEDTLAVARSLIGKTLCTKIDGLFCAATIVETEAYLGIEDRASHAFGNRQTSRTKTMYQAGGIAYVYLIYGLYSMLNVVVHQAGIPHAILLRAAHPVVGLDVMEHRRGRKMPPHQLLRGPGNLAKGMGINLRHNAISLQSDAVWLEAAPAVGLDTMVTTPRIGVDYAGADALLPYRFALANHPAVSGSRRQNTPLKTSDS